MPGGTSFLPYDNRLPTNHAPYFSVSKRCGRKLELLLQLVNLIDILIWYVNGLLLITFATRLVASHLSAPTSPGLKSERLV